MATPYVVALFFLIALIVWLPSALTRLGLHQPTDAELEAEVAPSGLVTTHGLAMELADRPKRIREYVLKQFFRAGDFRHIGREGPEVVYLIASHLDSFVEQALDMVEGPFVLVSSRGTSYTDGTEDNSVPGDAMSYAGANRLLEDKHLVAWFTTNPSETHRKLHPLPIGLDLWSRARRWGWHVQDTEGDTCGWECVWWTLQRPWQLVEPRLPSQAQEAQLLSLRSTLPPTSERKLAVYANVHLSRFNGYSWLKGYLKNGRSYVVQRWQDIAVLKGNPMMAWTPARQRREETLQEAGGFAFGLSVVGNGLDCYRTWEYLALGMIVVTRRTSLTDSGLFEGLPVVIVEDWSELTEVRLREELARFGNRPSADPKIWGRLQTAYWAGRVRDALGPTASLSPPTAFNSPLDAEFLLGGSTEVNVPGQGRTWLLGTATPGTPPVSVAGGTTRVQLMLQQAASKEGFIQPVMWVISNMMRDAAANAVAVATTARRELLKAAWKTVKSEDEPEPPWCPAARASRPLKRLLLGGLPALPHILSNFSAEHRQNHGLTASLPLKDRGSAPTILQLDGFLSPHESASVLEELRGWGWHGAYEPNSPENSRWRQDWDLPWVHQYPSIWNAYRRMTRLLGIGDEYAGAVTMLQYSKGHGYAPHVDWCGKGSEAARRNCGLRSFTFMIYLTGLPAGAGGETHWLHYDLKIRPVVGRAVVWSGAKPDNPDEPDQRSLHASMPVLAPNLTKTVLTVFFHQLPAGTSEAAGCC